MASRAAALVATAGLCLAGCSGTSAPGPDEPGATSTPSTSSGPAGGQGLSVEVVADGLSNPWDIGFLEDGGAVVTERDGRLSYLPSLDPGTEPVELAAGLDDVYAQGEGGLMGLAVLPPAEDAGAGWDQPKVIVCLNHGEGEQAVDVRLVELTLDVDNRRATRDRDLVTGLPTADSGRHSGCRPTLGDDGLLYVGTGDSADPAAPQDRGNLGGKVLRLDPATGEAAEGNPFADADDAREQLVYSYGHRNVQGVAVRPGTDEIWTAEHGPSFDDEVNLITAGANYGWDPAQGGEESSYDESVPMTDTERYPDAVKAAWSSGETTEAICGAAFLEGEAWGEREGMLAITALKGAKLLLLRLDGDSVTQVEIPEDLVDEHGRLRAARTGPDGALYVTTSNGDDDKVLRITPAG
ncbi:PQQ-dependent sugar dehydrogenase [Janibacter sp. YIM B02568]|uniref:PQQ-dependent sugar dehydrogenase n=1 Tax=Janibacter endophyticus TaxID=2806261 RepID=UPI00194EC7ED|nr:PQQ-dependent sugar dehydrogenase [Janibacter endophyticus]MBM6545398.1 PQQ-dependent sugar dehydrogenase [Janibacter endophyticus]